MWFELFIKTMWKMINITKSDILTDITKGVLERKEIKLRGTGNNQYQFVFQCLYAIDSKTPLTNTTKGEQN